MSRCISRMYMCACVVVLLSSAVTAQKLSWRHLDSVLYFSWSVATDPTGTLYVADGTPYIYSSTDDGANFISECVGSHVPRVYQIHATKGGVLFARTKAGVYKREAGSKVWLPITIDSGVGSVYSICSKGPDTILLTHSRGVVVSADGGSRWTPLGPAGTHQIRLGTISHLGSLIVVADDSLFRSSDGGIIWRGYQVPTSAAIRTLWSISADTMFLFTTNGNLFRSTDDGQSWSMSASLDRWTASVVSHPSGALLSLNFQDASLRRSSDGGRTWVRIFSRHPEFGDWGNYLVVDAFGRVLLGDNNDGLYRLDLVNNNVTQLRGRSLYPGLFRGSGSKLAVNARGTMVTWDGYGAPGRSVDSGYTWSFGESKNVSTFTLVEISAGHDGAFYVLSGDSLFISTDEGVTYTARSLPTRGPLSILHTRIGSILLSGSTGLFRSVDNAGSWTTSTMPAGESHVAALHEDGNGTLYSLTIQSHVLVSVDDGVNWNALQSAGLPTDCSALVVAQGNIFVLSATHGLFRSLDGGATFTHISAGRRYARFSCLAVDPAGRILLGASDINADGIIYSTDRGESWHDGNTGVVSPEQAFHYEPAVLDFELGRDGRMYALVDSGVYRMEEAILGIEYLGHRSNDIVAAAQPNPFHDRTTITWTLDRRGQVDVSVFDLLGRRVAVLASGTFAAGTHTVPFNGIGLPPGSYFVRLGTREGVLVLRVLRVP